MRNSRRLHCAAFLVAALLTACGPAAASPQPGATLFGTIAADTAQSGQIRFKVSDDGQKIGQVWVTFSELQCLVQAGGAAACARWDWGTATYADLDCRGFYVGILSTLIATDVPIRDGHFELESRSIGTVSGQFTSPTTAQGTIHLALFGGKQECGTWEWSTPAK